ncbi:hypothetical protein FQR65_LT20347 [Abscondita terminalis]|nr:hypothetical protein FQR65_LT20347 [Abscondita terminalis]
MAGVSRKSRETFRAHHIAPLVGIASRPNPGQCRQPGQADQQPPWAEMRASGRSMTARRRAPASPPGPGWRNSMGMGFPDTGVACVLTTGRRQPPPVAAPAATLRTTPQWQPPDHAGQDRAGADPQPQGAAVHALQAECQARAQPASTHARMGATPGPRAPHTSGSPEMKGRDVDTGCQHMGRQTARRPLHRHAAHSKWRAWTACATRPRLAPP